MTQVRKFNEVRRCVKRCSLLVVLFTACGIGFSEESRLRDQFPHDDFTLREVMIPMRDGVSLYTIIMTPKNAAERLPILMYRTPYDSTFVMRGRTSTRLGSNLQGMFLGNDYIYVGQDVRGRFKSEGDYQMFRPPRGPLNRTDTDHTTDTWDTIEWLTANVANNNGRVGLWGTSYPGWLTLAGIKEPHPALSAAVPFNPVGDLWKGDDFFHWGAFRVLFAFGFSYAIETSNDQRLQYPYENVDAYEWLLELGSVGSALTDRLGKQNGMWQQIVSNPAYGEVWRESAASEWFDAPNRLVPTLHVHGLWDQEDIYGAPAAYLALERHDHNNDMNFFVAGPWYHGQHFGTGDRIGRISFDESSAVRFRQQVLKPFLRKYLHETDEQDVAPVTVFETGSNRWRKFDSWPPRGKKVRLFLQPNGGLGFGEPDVANSRTTFISDPAKPVPYEPRPNWPWYRDVEQSKEEWRSWQLQDQRFVDGRPDVVTWVTEPLDENLTVRGPVTAHLKAETTGTDADWIVKLIDVYPEETAGFVDSGYQLMVSGEIFRGRYRSSLEKPAPIVPNKVLDYQIPMPHVNHTFKKGHRVMVHIQSTWFPLYDRNPQTFVKNIMFAPQEAYRTQQHAIHHGGENATYLEFRIDELN